MIITASRLVDRIELQLLKVPALLSDTRPEAINAPPYLISLPASFMWNHPSPIKQIDVGRSGSYSMTRSALPLLPPLFCSLPSVDDRSSVLFHHGDFSNTVGLLHGDPLYSNANVLDVPMLSSATTCKLRICYLRNVRLAYCGSRAWRLQTGGSSIPWSGIWRFLSLMSRSRDAKLEISMWS